MYPQYWTPGIGGIFMRYSYEYKKMCVELYRQGKWVETPEGVKEKNFRNMIQIWARTEESCGVEALRHKNQNKVWTAEEKYELVAKVLAGESLNFSVEITGTLIFCLRPALTEIQQQLLQLCHGIRLLIR